ncbi:four-carbon acid sugar kinase family protein [Vibrio sp. SA48]|uniref:3-oxo-tetronate kinase n=1 Tax=Vibrio sp. S12_S33 TaxID=2720223 RepID=UPI00177AE5B6|nr:3-oxo-tetronate kinase [Vibrio sp. S12_S33]MBD1566179.1 four-carbon acid sugar kinase family protein [Vibrio sp. S12_S33]
MLLGVIADDFTGATDIAGFLVENGMKTIQLTDVPAQGFHVNADAVVISLKSRSCPALEAVESSLTALAWLIEQGCQQFYFKYCSTFDSCEQGNIGPVTDALLDALGSNFTIVCPALPINGRTVFNGFLFVLGEPLNESGMRNHPVTPMTDFSVVRLMDKQSRGEVGLVTYQDIDQGVNNVKQCFDELSRQGKRYAVVDAINGDHLDVIGRAAKDLKLVTGGSGLATGIARNWATNLTDQSDSMQAGMPTVGKSVIFSGSCSVMTNRQVEYYKNRAASLSVDVQSCIENPNYSNEVYQWVDGHLDDVWAPLIYATTTVEELTIIQCKYGADIASQAVERFFSQLAPMLQFRGVTNYIVAGGETSGVVVKSLNVKGFYVGPQISPGVPWVRSVDQPLSLALKSGNFGNDNFFVTAQEFYHD